MRRGLLGRDAGLLGPVVHRWLALGALGALGSCRVVRGVAQRVAHGVAQGVAREVARGVARSVALVTVTAMAVPAAGAASVGTALGTAVGTAVGTSLGVAASGPAAPLVTDDRGRPVRLERPPRRIVTLLPSLTETVCALGGCDQLVGTDRHSNWPPRVVALPKLGGLEDASLEAVVALKPDLVLAGTSARVLDRLEALGLVVVALDTKTVADAHRSMATVARLLGRPEAADATWARIEARISAAAARVPPAWRGARVYFEVSSTPHAAGAGSFIGELLTMLGLGQAVPAALGPFPALNPEFVVRARPDLMMGSELAVRSMRTRPGWATLPALQRGHQCGFDGPRFDMLVRPGPRLADAADLVAQCLAALPPRGDPEIATARPLPTGAVPATGRSPAAAPTPNASPTTLP